MNFYRVDVSFKCDEAIDGFALETTFLSHTEVFAPDKFKNICDTAKQGCIDAHGDACLYDIVNRLITVYGFKSIETVAQWECQDSDDCED